MTMCDLLPLGEAEIKRFGYKRFFRTLIKAKASAKRQQDQVDKLKNKKR